MLLLLVVPPLVGHVSPVLGVAEELVRRGHRVLWAGDRDFLEGFGIDPSDIRDAPAPWSLDDAPARPAELRGPSAFKFLWEDVFLPLAESMAAGVERAIREEAPDLVLVDQQTLAGAFVAERLGVPWATSATTSAELSDPLAGLPKVAEWLHEHFRVLRERFGDPQRTDDPRFSPLLTLAFSAPELLGLHDGFATPVDFVGPVLRPRPVEDPTAIDWAARSGGPVVLVALGTANAEVGAPFLAAAHDALLGATTTIDGASVRVRAIIADPTGSLAGRAEDEHVLVLPTVPQQVLLEHVDLLIGHAGHNSVCEALWSGVPMVLAPIRDDQPIIAAQVVDGGAGLRLRFGRSTPERIREAAIAVLEGPDFLPAAVELGRRLRAAGGATAAADALEGAVVGVGSGARR